MATFQFSTERVAIEDKDRYCIYEYDSYKGFWEVSKQYMDSTSNKLKDAIIVKHNYPTLSQNACIQRLEKGTQEPINLQFLGSSLVCEIASKTILCKESHIPILKISSRVKKQLMAETKRGIANEIQEYNELDLLRILYWVSKPRTTGFEWESNIVKSLYYETPDEYKKSIGAVYANLKECIERKQFITQLETLKKTYSRFMDPSVIEQMIAENNKSLKNDRLELETLVKDVNKIKYAIHNIYSSDITSEKRLHKNKSIELALLKEEKCPISLEPLEVDKLSVTSCFHVFSTESITKALQRRKNCPMCNQNCTLL